MKQHQTQIPDELQPTPQMGDSAEPLPPGAGTPGNPNVNDALTPHGRAQLEAQASDGEAGFPPPGPPPRDLTGHKVNPANDLLQVLAIDGPGPGGASHHYVIGHEHGVPPFVTLHFQNGPINDVGVNGITHEALLAVLIDRLEGFQSGPYANAFNATALTYLQSAQRALLDRTRERMARGVEGTNQQ